MNSPCGHSEAECIIGNYYSCPICDQEKEKPVQAKSSDGVHIDWQVVNLDRIVPAYDSKMPNLAAEIYGWIKNRYGRGEFEVKYTGHFGGDYISVNKKGHVSEEGAWTIPTGYTLDHSSRELVATGSSSQQQRTQGYPGIVGHQNGVATLPLQSLRAPASGIGGLRTLPPPGIGRRKTSSTPMRLDNSIGRVIWYRKG